MIYCVNCGWDFADELDNLCRNCRDDMYIEIGERPEGYEAWEEECEDDWHGD
jgi:hypothetical protein